MFAHSNEKVTKVEGLEGRSGAGGVIILTMWFLGLSVLGLRKSLEVWTLKVLSPIR